MSEKESMNIKGQDNTNIEDKKKISVEIDANPSFIKRLFANILDQAIILGISAIILMLFDLIIGFIGYMVVEPTTILFIIDVIVNIIYQSILQSKDRRTIGKRILGII
ncbi:RDD family protein [Clostridium sp.]|uniref:RDD family protein n=1 Tax=Clostridium sp. TaxID=1506 RepID=UPI002A91F03C|nr:RDD family protein [Clostridium sp.]MDY6011895.1 RDD family protein [Clostridium sp.]